MDNVLKYKDFIGTVNFSAEDGVFYGKIEGIKSMVSFEGETVHDLEENQHQDNTRRTQHHRRNRQKQRHFY